MYPSVCEQLDQVTTTLAQLAGTDFDTLDDTALHETVAACAAARERLEAITAAAVGAWDTRMVWASDGATSGAAWLRAHGEVEGAAGLVKRSRKLRDYAPLTAQAVAEGSLSFDKAMAIVAPVTQDLAPAFEQSEAAILEAAKVATLNETKRLAASWRAIAENDLDIDVFERQLRKRHVQVWDNPDGSVEGHFWFDPLSGASFRAQLAKRERKLFRDDVREARATAGLPHDPDADSDGLSLPRTAAQRKADALCELVEFGSRVDPNVDDGHLPAPSAELVITMSDDHLAALTDHDTECGCTDGTCAGAIADDQDHPLPASVWVLYACDSVLYRLALDKAGVPLNLSRSQRRASPAQLRALRVRDGGCAFPGCDRPASWCDAPAFAYAKAPSAPASAASKAQPHSSSRAQSETRQRWAQHRAALATSRA